MSRRWARWASSSSRITELRPMTGSRMRAPLPGCSTSAGAVKTSLTAPGSASMTKGGVASRWMVNRRPWRARQRSKKGTGRVHQFMVCSQRGARGPDGSEKAVTSRL